MNKRIVLDTNVLLVSISSKSQYHWIYKKLLEDKYDLLITNEILTEYEEIISKKYNPIVAQDVIRVLLLLPNVHQIIIYYNWNLITIDHDDNKFVDCAITGNVDYIVTHDTDFDILKTIKFPEINILNVFEFKEILKQRT
jgi:uncharacterized protein